MLSNNALTTHCRADKELRAHADACPWVTSAKAHSAASARALLFDFHSALLSRVSLACTLLRVHGREANRRSGSQFLPLLKKKIENKNLL